MSELKLTAHRLTAQHGAVLLQDFYERWEKAAPGQMEASYWWKRPPRTLVVGERMYSFEDPAIPTIRLHAEATPTVIGFGSFVLNTRDADDEEASLTIGVFPEHQRKGYRRLIIDFLCMKAALLGASRMQQLVYKTNAVHYERTKKECQDPASKWVWAGDIWYPPEKALGYFIRILKEDK